MKSFKIDNQKKNQILKDITFTKKNHQNSYFFVARHQDITIHIYANNTFLVQGDQKQINAFLLKYQLNANKQTELDTTKVVIPYFGCDESGVGDLFGPIVMTVFYVDKEMAIKLKRLEIGDSKKMELNQIEKTATWLMKHKNYFATTIVSNQEFNKHFGINMNLKELLTFYYVQTIEKFVIGKKYTKIIIDGFASEKNFTKYCQKLNLKSDHQIKLITKAENQYLGVGAASIISRYVFLQEIKKIEKLIKRKILLGANSKVKLLVQELITNPEIDIKKIAKIGYSGVQKEQKNN